jgi:hypothetical protein
MKIGSHPVSFHALIKSEQGKDVCRLRYLSAFSGDRPRRDKQVCRDPQGRLDA